MGKDLKGKNLGKGICQRKDGLYSARYTKEGKRHEAYFKTVAQAKKWLSEPEPMTKTLEMTVDEWYEFWMNNLICDLAPNTKRNYKDRYEKNVRDHIGNMLLSEVKPMHCKMILNKMEPSYAVGTMYQTYILLGTMFRSAIDNDLISKHPMNGVKINKPKRAVDDIRFLTVTDQKKFLEVAKKSLELRYFALQYPDWRRKYTELLYDSGTASKRADQLYLNNSKVADRTAEIAIQRKLLSDKMHAVEQAAINAEPDLYTYILKSVTENLTFATLKVIYSIPCERDMFYDRRRKFYWLLAKTR